jgi:hypothetical protein
LPAAQQQGRGATARARRNSKGGAQQQGRCATARAKRKKAREDIYQNEVLLLSLFDLKNLLYIHNNCFFLFLFSLLPQSKFE